MLPRQNEDIIHHQAINFKKVFGIVKPHKAGSREGENGIK